MQIRTLLFLLILVVWSGIGFCTPVGNYEKETVLPAVAQSDNLRQENVNMIALVDHATGLDGYNSLVRQSNTATVKKSCALYCALWEDACSFCPSFECGTDGDGGCYHKCCLPPL